MNKKINLILRCVALAMGVAVVVLRVLNQLDNTTSVTLLGIGMVALSITQIENK